MKSCIADNAQQKQKSDKKSTRYCRILTKLLSNNYISITHLCDGSGCESVMWKFAVHGPDDKNTRK